MKNDFYICKRSLYDQFKQIEKNNKYFCDFSGFQVKIHLENQIEDYFFIDHFLFTTYFYTLAEERKEKILKLNHYDRNRLYL